MSKTYRYPGLNLGSTDAGTDKAAESLLFGFWIFLMSDLVLFGLLFANFAAQSQHGTAGGPVPGAFFDLKHPFIETMCLLASSYTFGLASLALKYREDSGRLVFWLIVTFMLGAAFLGIESYDFASDMAKHQGPQHSGFISSYFALVGTHGIHVTSGMLWMLVMLVQIAVFGLNRAVKTRLMRLAIFWHMLDVVWIGIFTFVYLFGVLQ